MNTALSVNPYSIMNEAALDLWIDVLENGNLAQVQSMLFDVEYHDDIEEAPSITGYCCIGVAAKCVGMKLLDRIAEAKGSGTSEVSSVLGFPRGLQGILVGFNDTLGMSFVAIAQWLRMNKMRILANESFATDVQMYQIMFLAVEKTVNKKVDEAIRKAILNS